MKYKSNSRENQDLFVLAVTDKKRNGTYFEIGASEPIEVNNTYLLETEFDWTGISLEILEEKVKKFNLIRKNKCLCLDATKADLTQIIIENNLAPHVDFLQLDIDPYFNTFKALNNIDFDKVSFSIVTYEHDAYRGGTKEREMSRKILESKGYTLVIGDVTNKKRGKNLKFEDWYINEKYIQSESWKGFCGDGIVMNTPHVDNHIQKLLEKLL